MAEWSGGALRRLSLGLLLVAGICLPFENPRPLIQFSLFDLTNLEALLALAVGSWIVGWLVRRQPPARLPTYFLGPLVAVLVTSWVSAALAPSLTVSALKMAGRWTLGALVGWLVWDQACVPDVRRWLAGAVGLGAILMAAVGLLDWLGVAWATDWLNQFRVGPERLGPALRLNASFGSANTTAMVLTVAICLVMGHGQGDRETGRLGKRTLFTSLLVTLGTCLLSLALALTYSRGGLAAAMVGVGVMVWAAGRRWHTWAPMVAAMGLGVGLAVWLSPALGARLAVWDRRPLDGAAFVAPARLAAQAGAVVTATLEVTNTGRLTWRTVGVERWAVAYHWLAESGDEVLKWDNPLLALPRDVAPGEAVEVVATLTLPTAGRYRLLWDLAQPGGEWLAARTALDAWTLVEVTGADGLPLQRVYESVAPSPPPERLALWSAALAMVRDYPILGVGPGGFRHRYGAYLGLADADIRVLANNLYLELLADVGLVGLLAWGWLLGTGVWAAWQGARRGDGVTLGVVGALMAWLAHGVVDVALETTAIYAMWWILIGLAHGEGRKAGRDG